MAQRRPRAEPAYRAIAEQLRAEIESGRFGDGQQLPSESEVMARFRVSRETARRAYIELVAAGNAARRQGSGSFAVRRDQMPRLSFGSIGDLAAHTRSSSVEATEALAVRRDPELAAALGASDDRVATLTFKWLKGGLPYCVARIGLPVTVGNRLLERGAFEAIGPTRDDTVLALVESAAGERVVEASQARTAAPAGRPSQVPSTWAATSTGSCAARTAAGGSRTAAPNARGSSTAIERGGGDCNLPREVTSSAGSCWG